MWIPITQYSNKEHYSNNQLNQSFIMTTPNKKKQLALKKALKEKDNIKLADAVKGEAKVVDMSDKADASEADKNMSDRAGTNETNKEVQPHPQMPSDEPQMKVEIVGKMLKTMLSDPMGYLVAIDFIQISNVTRCSYNVIMNELVIVLPETTGRIGEMQIPITNQQGKKTGGMRQEVAGQITSFKTKISGEEDIRKFLEVYVGESPLSEETFQGFKHYNIAKEVLNKAAQLKREEADKKKGGSLVDEHGEPLISM